MSQRSVVLIEDDPGDALLVADMLFAVSPDVRLTQFTTLQAAVDDWPPHADCVLLDLGLPDAVGLSALHRLRAQAPDVPVVVLTGRVDETSGPAALAAGAQDYLVKGEVERPCSNANLSLRRCGRRRTRVWSVACCQARS